MTGQVYKQSASTAGDGTICTVVQIDSSGVRTIIWGPTLVTDQTGFQISFTVGLKIGETLSFEVNQNQNTTNDATRWDPTIIYQW